MRAASKILLFLFLLGVAGAQAQPDAAAQPQGQAEEAEIEFVPSKYRILAIRPLPGVPGIQTGFSRARYLVNFGAREGIKRGSVFQIFRKMHFVGLVHVSRVWTDTAYVRPIRLESKPDRDALFPLLPGYQLKPKYVMLETIHFDLGKPQFSIEMNERLHFASRFINAFPNFPLVLEGHTDSEGDSEKNLILSQQRAEEIKIYLNEIHFIPLVQMHIKAFGAGDPIASNATEEGRLQNRRVDIVLMDAIPE